jgi:hypothetical protein
MARAGRSRSQGRPYYSQPEPNRASLTISLSMLTYIDRGFVYLTIGSPTARVVRINHASWRTARRADEQIIARGSDELQDGIPEVWRSYSNSALNLAGRAAEAARLLGHRGHVRMFPASEPAASAPASLSAEPVRSRASALSCAGAAAKVASFASRTL